ELSARVRAMLRRPTMIASETLQLGSLSLNSQTLAVARAGRDIQLSKKEFALLEVLARHPGQVFSIDQLIDKIWSSDNEASPDTVRVHVTRLRSKVEIDGLPTMIKTVHGVGYKLESDEKR